MIFIGDVWLKPEEVMQVRVKRKLEAPNGPAGPVTVQGRVEVDPFDCGFPWEDPALAESRRDEVARKIIHNLHTRRILGEDE